MHLELPGAGESPPQAGDGLPANAEPTALGGDVEFGDLGPGAAQRGRAPSQNEPHERPVVSHKERVAAGFGPIQSSRRQIFPT
jgi:hypothetical protein